MWHSWFLVRKYSPKASDGGASPCCWNYPPPPLPGTTGQRPLVVQLSKDTSIFFRRVRVVGLGVRPTTSFPPSPSGRRTTGSPSGQAYNRKSTGAKSEWSAYNRKWSEWTGVQQEVNWRQVRVVGVQQEVRAYNTKWTGVQQRPPTFPPPSSQSGVPTGPKKKKTDHGLEELVLNTL